MKNEEIIRKTKPKNIAEFLQRLTLEEQEFLWEHIAKIRELDKEEQKPVACGDGTIDSSYEVIINAAIYWGKEAPTENGIIPADKVKDAVDYYCSLLRNNDGWSEKDEKYLKLAIENFQTLGNSFLTTWLKNIKDRCTWKPSRKQMKDLAFVADQNKGNMVGKTMISLYKDLKRLE